MNQQELLEVTAAIRDLSKVVSDLRANHLDPYQLLTTLQVAQLWGSEKDTKLVTTAIKAGLPTIELGTKGHRIMRKDAIEWCEKLRVVTSNRQLSLKRREFAA